MTDHQNSNLPEKEEQPNEAGWEGRGARESQYVPIKTHGREDGPAGGISAGNKRPSDEEMTQDLIARLKDNGDMASAHIQVEVRNGEITLRGNVVNALISQMAESVANEVPGVVDVHNELTARSGPEAEQSPRQE